MSAAVCGILHKVPFYLRWRIPPRYNLSQQLAELYCFVHAFRWISRRFLTFTLVTDSTSTLFSVRSFNAGVKQPMRARLLAQLALAVVNLKDTVYAGWIPSALHPADSASRDWPFTNKPLPYISPHSLLSTNCNFNLFTDI